MGAGIAQLAASAVITFSFSMLPKKPLTLQRNVFRAALQISYLEAKCAKARAMRRCLG
jgi:hypothetical protein